uniref:Uncharacterized protein n=1 Tax=Arundo donax TaxID=35708 RepID=A0A0A8ZQW9_ARUDO
MLLLRLMWILVHYIF